MGSLALYSSASGGRAAPPAVVHLEAELGPQRRRRCVDVRDSERRTVPGGPVHAPGDQGPADATALLLRCRGEAEDQRASMAEPNPGRAEHLVRIGARYGEEQPQPGYVEDRVGQ